MGLLANIYQKAKKKWDEWNSPVANTVKTAARQAIKTSPIGTAYSAYKTVTQPKVQSSLMNMANSARIFLVQNPDPVNYAMPKIRSTVVQPLQRAVFSNPAPQWMQKADKGLHKFSTAAENIPRFTFANKVKNPFGRFAAEIPQGILNIPSKAISSTFKGYNDIKTGKDNAEWMLKRGGEAAEVGLDIGAMFTGGGTVKRLATQGMKSTGKRSLAQAAKQGMIRGMKEGAGYGAGYGITSGLQSEGNVRQKLKQSFKNIPASAAIGGVMGGAIGGAAPYIGDELLKIKKDLGQGVSIIKNPKSKRIIDVPVTVPNGRAMIHGKPQEMIVRYDKVVSEVPQRFLPQSRTMRSLQSPGLTIKDVSGDINPRTELNDLLRQKNKIEQKFNLATSEKKIQELQAEHSRITSAIAKKEEMIKVQNKKSFNDLLTHEEAAQPAFGFKLIDDSGNEFLPIKQMDTAGSSDAYLVLDKGGNATVQYAKNRNYAVDPKGLRIIRDFDQNNKTIGEMFQFDKIAAKNARSKELVRKQLDNQRQRLDVEEKGFVAPRKVQVPGKAEKNPFQILRHQIGDSFEKVEPVGSLWKSRGNTIFIKPNRSSNGYLDWLRQKNFIENADEAGNNIYRVKLKLPARGVEDVSKSSQKFQDVSKVSREEKLRKLGVWKEQLQQKNQSLADTFLQEAGDLKKYYKNAYKVSSGQKEEAFIGKMRKEQVPEKVTNGAVNSFDKKIRQELGQSMNTVNVGDEIVNLAKSEFTPYQVKKIKISDTNPDSVAIAKSAGINIDGYVHEADNYAIKHAYDKHSHDKIPLTYEDLRSIPAIISNPDSIEYVGKNNRNLDVLLYKKRHNGVTHYVEEIRTGRKTLNFNTMYIKETPSNGANYAADQSALSSSRPSLGGTPTPSLSVSDVNSSEILSEGRPGPSSSIGVGSLSHLDKNYETSLYSSMPETKNSVNLADQFLQEAGSIKKGTKQATASKSEADNFIKEMKPIRQVIDEKTMAEIWEAAARKDIGRQALIDPELEPGYETFKNIFNNPKARNPKVKEALMDGDLETLRRELMQRGIMRSEQVDDMTYHGEMSGDDVLDYFKAVLMDENKEKMTGKKIADNLYRKNPITTPQDDIPFVGDEYSNPAKNGLDQLTGRKSYAPQPGTIEEIYDTYVKNSDANAKGLEEKTKDILEIIPEGKKRIPGDEVNVFNYPNKLRALGYKKKEIETIGIGEARSIIDRWNARHDPDYLVKKAEAQRFRDFVGEFRQAEQKGIERGLEFLKKHSNIPNDKAAAIIHYLDNPGQAPAEIAGHVKTLRNEFDSFYREAKTAGLDVGYWDNYITHIWKEDPRTVAKKIDRALKKGIISPEEIAGMNGDPTKTPYFGYANQRMLATYAIGEKIGLHKKYAHPAQIVAHYAKQLEKAKAIISNIQKFKEAGAVVEGPAPGFKPLTAQGMEGLFAKSEIANKLNEAFRSATEDYYTTAGGKLLEKTAGASRFLKEMLMSGGVPGTTVNSYGLGMTLKEVATMSPTRIKNALESFAVANSPGASRKFFLENLDQIKKLQKNDIMVSTMIDDGGFFSQGFFKDLGAIEGFRGKSGFIWEKMMNEPTFKRFLPMNQIKFFNSVESRLLGRGYSAQEAEKLAVKELRESFGLGSAAKEMAKSKLWKDWRETLFFAPAHRMSMIRMFGNAAKTFTRNPLKAGNREMTKFVAGGMALYALYDWVNYKNTGKHLYENPTGKKFEAYIKTGEGKLVSVPFLPTVATMPRLGINVGEKLLDGDITGALGSAWQGSGSLLTKPMADVVMNKDYFDRPIRNEDDSASKQWYDSMKYLGKAYSGHPWIKAGIDYAGGKPVSQVAAQAAEAPIRFTTEDKLLKTEFYDEFKKFKPVAEKYAELLETAQYNDDYTKANEYYSRHKDEIDTYDRYRPYEKVFNNIKYDKENPKEAMEIMRKALMENKKGKQMQTAYDSDIERKKAVDEVLKTLSPQEKIIYDKIRFGKYYDDNGMPISSKDGKMSNAHDKLANPGIMEAEEKIARRVSETTGEPLLPFYELSPQQKRIVLRLETFYPGDDDYSTMTSDNIEWLKPYWEKRSEYFDQLKASGKMKESGQKIIKFDGKTDLNVAEADILLPADNITKLQDEYYSYPKGTGQRSRLVAAHPELKTWWDASAAFKNMQREELGIPLKENKGFSSTGYTGYKRKKTGTGKNVAKKSSSVKKTASSRSSKSTRIKPIFSRNTELGLSPQQKVSRMPQKLRYRIAIPKAKSLSLKPKKIVIRIGSKVLA